MLADPRRHRFPAAQKRTFRQPALLKPNRHEPRPAGEARREGQQPRRNRGAVWNQHAAEVDHARCQQAQQHRGVQAEGEGGVPRALEPPGHVRQERPRRRVPRSPMHDLSPEQSRECRARRQFHQGWPDPVPPGGVPGGVRAEEPPDDRQPAPPPPRGEGAFVRVRPPEAAELVPQPVPRPEPHGGDVHQPPGDAPGEEHGGGEGEAERFRHGLRRSAGTARRSARRRRVEPRR